MSALIGCGITRILLATLCLGVTAAQSATILVQPSPSTVTLGQVLTLDIDVDSVNDLYAWQFDLNFDPTVLTALGITEGDFLSAGGATFFLAGTIDNIGGSITFTADSLQSAIAGVSGSGRLAQVQFQALGLGLSGVALANAFLVDSQVNVIDTTTTDGSISVVPEPSVRTLSLACLLALALFGLMTRSSRRTGTVAAAFLILFGTVSTPANAADIVTAQFDTARTGAYGSETYLTTTNVNGTRFGKLFTRTVDGAIYTQPLYAQGLTIATKKTNVVYVATSHDNVYAFDADNPNTSTPIWSVNLGTYDTPSGWATGLGVLSTPQIIRASNAIYLVSATRESGARVYRLHALDLVTGTEKFGGPVVISGSIPGTSGDAQNGTITFAPNSHIQRTGLALSGNDLIITFTADRDHQPYHGWVFSYDKSSLQQTGVFNDARNNPAENGTGAGIWQSGRAPAIDANGAVYVETGNGTFDGTLDFGESFLKLSPGGLALSDWFTPEAWSALNDVDYDLSSTGPTLIPGTNLVFGGSKSGTIYLLSTGNLGHLSSGDANIVQQFTATSGCVIPLVNTGCAQIMGQVFWATAPTPTLYVWGVNDVLRTYSFSNGHFNTTPISVGSAQANYPGGVMALSSYLGTAGTGILWTITSDTPDNGFFFGPGFNTTATVHAYDAANPATELWNSAQNPIRDSLGEFASFTPPIAVNGKVYVPTFSNQLVVYGLLSGPVPGDVNGDSSVTCADLTILKASFGKSAGQLGFDLRADVNGDGVVNVLDLATVSKQLPGGSACQ